MKKTSKIENVRRHLLRGYKLTPMQANTKWHYTRLASGIHKLRQNGVPINSQIITKNDTSFSVYWIDKKDLKLSRALI